MSIEVANVIRGVAIGEILFCVGFLLARVWRYRRCPWRYLSLMGLALISYSFFAAFILFGRWDDPLSWEAPLVIIAATLSCVAAVRERMNPREIPERRKK